MQLKSLEIKGFKSFADKTTILLDNPVTGIVGPNGCGKSNIIDAIRWVIGEHKIKSLRSDNLEDLIFNGSKSRAASGMAEVSLTFENTKNLLPTEFNTVTVTRKFYRNGDSEYRLNDVSCRLKDIHNLFLDTGVSNDSYAIIELGMVDDIIKDKDGSRRKMLEQAAGISIYKARKKEAKQKLESTEQDISRIEDLLFEISNNLRSLESQAKKAEKYLVIKKDYKEISIELAKKSLSSFHEQYQSLHQKIDAETDKKVQYDALLSGDEAEITKNKLELTQQEQELSASQRRFNELINRIRQLENEKKLAAQRLTYLQERAQNLTQLINTSADQQQQLNDNIELNKGNIATNKIALKDLQEQLTQIKFDATDKQIVFEEAKTALDQAKDKLIKHQQSQFLVDKNIAVNETAINNLARNKAQIEQEIINKSDQIKALTDRQIVQNSLITEKEIEYNSFKEKQESLTQDLETQRANIELNTNELNLLNRQLDAKKNEFSMLKSMIDRLEGFPDSIKFLSKSTEWNVDAPLVSDVVNIDEKYKKALENALDNYLNYYIVNQEEDAFKAISILENNKKGKANFLIRNQFKPIQQQSNTFDNHLPLAQLISIDKGFESVINQLIHNVFVVENIEEMTTSVPQGCALVDLEGKIKKSHQYISGGYAGIFEGNKTGRLQKLQNLQKEIDTLNVASTEKLQGISQLQSTLSEIKANINPKELQAIFADLNLLKTQAYGFEHQLSQLKSINNENTVRLENLQDEINTATENSEKEQAQLTILSKEFAQNQADVNSATEIFKFAEQDYNILKNEINEVTLQIAKQQSKIDQQQQEIDFREKQLTDLINQTEDNKTQLADASLQISDTSGKLNFGDDELVQEIQKKERDEKILANLERQFHTLRNKISEHESLISRQRKEREITEQLLNALKEKVSEMKLQLSGIRERLQVEFKVDIDSILDERPTTDLSQEELQAEVERLKKRLENFGEINPTAIEAYQEMKIRHDFIVEQKDDLVAAKNNLLATIEEVENTANNRFKDTFEAVRENFIKVFKELFTLEDNADLRLTDPDNMADTNIEIFAQPKGKRPSTLTQLSGGEKTLTSTAYLFAIYLIKPAPFCILDEVDAPLDDANVHKFTSMIRKFSDNSQFIMITHNKQSMATVDVIYGVTMQDAGVSKIVPVDFRNLEEN